MIDNEEKLKVLELYSGIGGMHYGLKLSKLNADVVAAVDINPNANLVYKHNFPETKILNKTIEGIKLDELNRLNFDIILMSPPCQPFTRQGNQNGMNDNRAKSFLCLIDQISLLNKKPKYILMENVKGFDQDEARNQLIQMLIANNYTYQEFLLSPIQFGIPNSRLRYFMIARLNEKFCFDTNNSTIMTSLPANEMKNIDDYLKNLKFDLNLIKSQLYSDDKIDNSINNNNENLFGLIKHTQLNESYENCVQSESIKNVKKLNEFVLNEMGNNIDLRLNKDIFLKSLNSIDLVTHESTRSSCFTKNYGRYIDGTGSMLHINENMMIKNENDMIKISHDSIRFFTPKEISNLHCFPDDFEFPSSLTTIQKWKLIGNSLNVFIVSVLINLMIN